VPLKVEPDTRANQLLPQRATLIGIDLGACILEELVFDERTHLGIEIVIRAGNNLPREVRVTCSPASVDWDSTGYGVSDLDARGFGVVNADPGASIRLEPPTLGRDSQNEVEHERARIDPGGHVALCYNVVKAIPQGEVSATAKAIVKEVAFNRGTNYARAKDVTEFNAAEKANVILRVDLQSGIKIPIVFDKAVVTRKGPGSAAVLKDIGPRVDRTVETESIHWRRRRRRDLLIDLRSGLQRSRDESDQYSSREIYFFHSDRVITDKGW
jgi:hypothetical protein